MERCYRFEACTVQLAAVIFQMLGREQLECRVQLRALRRQRLTRNAIGHQWSYSWLL